MCHQYSLSIIWTNLWVALDRSHHLVGVTLLTSRLGFGAPGRNPTPIFAIQRERSSIDLQAQKLLLGETIYRGSLFPARTRDLSLVDCRPPIFVSPLVQQNHYTTKSGLCKKFATFFLTNLWSPRGESNSRTYHTKIGS